MRAVPVVFALAVVVVAIHLAAGCTVARPFRGPGFRPGTGVVADDAGDTVVVQLTHAVLDPDLRRPFDEHTELVNDAMTAHEGLIGYSLRKQLFGDEVWTLSVWRDEAALSDFVRSDVYRAAMESGAPAVVSMRSRKLDVPREDIPLSWKRAVELLDEAEAGYGAE